MKKLLLLAVLAGLWAAPARATITLVQQAASGSSCSTSATTCSITVSATGAGHFGIITTRHNSTVSLSSVTTGGTWTVPAGCHLGLSGTGGASCAYILNLSGGVTTITVTWSSAPGQCGFVFREYSYTGSSVALDPSGGLGTRSSSTNPAPGVGLTLTGSNDLVVQGLAVGGTTTISGISSPYGNFATNSTGEYGGADLENTVSGAAPNWTLNAAGGAVATAIAIAESSSGGPAAPPPSQMMLGCCRTGERR